MNELSLFAGAGGGLLASRLLDWKTVCGVEIDPYCRRVLMQRQNDGMLDPFPIWDDVRTFDGTAWRGCVDVVSGGFPCQPFSVAGRRKGGNDSRNLWPDTVRIIREVGPRFVFLENVPALRCNSKKEGLLPNASYYGRVLGDLAESGFDVRWRVLSASELGAPHRRHRLWIMAHPQSKREIATEQQRPWNGVESNGEIVANTDTGYKQPQDEVRPRGNVVGVGDKDLAHTGGPRLEIKQRKQNYDGEKCPAIERSRDSRGWWTTEPGMGRVVNGLAHRVDRLRALGNGQVSIVAATAWRLLTGGQQ